MSVLPNDMILCVILCQNAKRLYSVRFDSRFGAEYNPICLLLFVHCMASILGTSHSYSRKWSSYYMCKLYLCPMLLSRVLRPSGKASVDDSSIDFFSTCETTFSCVGLLSHVWDYFPMCGTRLSLLGPPWVCKRGYHSYSDVSHCC